MHSRKMYSLLYRSYAEVVSSDINSVWLWNVSSDIKLSWTTLDLPDAFFFNFSIWLAASDYAASCCNLFSRAPSSKSCPSSVVWVILGLVTIFVVSWIAALLLEIDLFRAANWLLVAGLTVRKDASPTFRLTLAPAPPRVWVLVMLAGVFACSIRLC